MKLDFLNKIDFDVVIIMVLIWSSVLILSKPNISNLVIEVTKDAIIAYAGYTRKDNPKRQKETPPN